MHTLLIIGIVVMGIVVVVIGSLGVLVIVAAAKLEEIKNDRLNMLVRKEAGIDGEKESDKETLSGEQDKEQG